MTRQLDLLYSPRFDPDTSRVAAEKSGAFRAGHEAKIYDVLSQVRSDEIGFNYREIAFFCKLEPVAVARRLISMERRKLITRRRSETTGKYIERDGCAVWWKA